MSIPIKSHVGFSFNDFTINKLQKGKSPDDLCSKPLYIRFDFQFHVLHVFFRLTSNVRDTITSAAAHKRTTYDHFEARKLELRQKTNDMTLTLMRIMALFHLYRGASKSCPAMGAETRMKKLDRKVV